MKCIMFAKNVDPAVRVAPAPHPAAAISADAGTDDEMGMPAQACSGDHERRAIVRTCQPPATQRIRKHGVSELLRRTERAEMAFMRTGAIPWSQDLVSGTPRRRTAYAGSHRLHYVTRTPHNAVSPTESRPDCWGGGKPDRDPDETHGGCFLPDLTRLARCPSATDFPRRFLAQGGIHPARPG
jgi:hypothetical protein